MRNYKYVFAFLIPIVVITAGGLFAGSSEPGASSSQAEPFQTSAQFQKFQMCGTITTVVGTGEIGFSGDGGPAIQAMISRARGVAVDSQGNLYIADTGNNRIRKVDNPGTITTIAGTGEKGFSGDGVPGLQAIPKDPPGVVVDEGTLYMKEAHHLRKVDTQGIITTVAGTGESGFSGDGGPVTQATLSHPFGVALDSQGNLYIADSVNNRIRKVDTQGIITTVAGTGETGFSGDGGPATQATLGYLSGVALDSQGNLYIAEAVNNRIRKVDTQGIITTVAGTGESGFSGDGGPATQATLNYPSGVALDSQGNLYIAETVNNRIRKVDTQGIVTTIAGTGQKGFAGDGGPATQATLDSPSGVAVDSQGNLYISIYRDWDFSTSLTSRIRKVSLCLPAPEKRFYEYEGEQHPFIHPSSLPPPQGRSVSPASQGRAKAGGVPPILKKAAPAERAAAKPSLLQRIKSFFSPQKTGPTSEDIK